MVIYLLAQNGGKLGVEQNARGSGGLLIVGLATGTPQTSETLILCFLLRPVFGYYYCGVGAC
jgi:hypothetical protein